MTTSHRPQLEARSGSRSHGNSQYVPTKLEHARLLPGHTKLKRRRGKSGRHKRGNEADSSVDKVFTVSEATSKSGGRACSDVGEEHSALEVGDGDGGGDVGSSYGEESDEEGLLLQELERLRSEKMMEKVKAQQLEEDKSLEAAADSGNDLEGHGPNVAGSSSEGWRSDAVFGRRKKPKSERKNLSNSISSDKYTNDLIQSEYHQDFLKRMAK
ncbi:U2-type spliceosomal complex subunit CWC15 Ecym_4227 [Eremothecium cymbalariae DBVPG|uniref:Pre-mRNA-splicing factor CWC15 n=1 Tax=Eremothecium cymbalariae (strain CBS 270.75 / DBVPG 7215 / KCTC 17166 / NRRL Y-17582) TaxID=931890 RepID=G8JTE1_ERECY|nr:hypothetical protein Ecym_4227 [Eremothecium cymbalariae DBVPG\